MSPESQPVDLASARFEAIIASAMDAIVTVDENFRIIGFNPAAERMFGISAQEVLGDGLDRFIPAPLRAQHRRHVERFARTGESYRTMGALGAVNALRANGEAFPAEASISQADVNGERLSTVILRDITDRKTQEATLLLAREVDHRAKNILAIVASLIDLTQASDQAAYAQALSGRVAALSRAHALLAKERWTGGALGELVREELEAHAGRSRYCATGPSLMLCQRAVQPISMLLHELATNAIKYGALSVPGGQVTLHWAQTDDGAVTLGWRERGGPPVHEPKEQGFGTALISQIVRHQLGGSVAIDWAAAGLVFAARLPAEILKPDQGDIATSAGNPVLAPTTGAPASDRPSASAVKAGTLLIVEDEPLLAMQLRQSLGEFGWTVIGVAGTVEDANRMLAEQPRPDAAILDVDLGGVPVFPLARALRHAAIPFIFCTGFEDVGYAREFADCCIVRKPATVLQIVSALRAVIRKAGDTAGFMPEI
jgi:PAS domain S-box-containing protein